MDRKVIFITGANRGFGAAIADAALAGGYRVVATARDPARIELADHPDILRLVLDVTDAEQAKAAAEEAVRRFGRIDVLVNNAGLSRIGMIEEATGEDLEAVFGVNVIGALNVIRAVLPTMRAQRSGHVINLSSLAAFAPPGGSGVYAVSKAALEALSETLARETAFFGIRVTAVQPGSFRTDFMARSTTPMSGQIDAYSRLKDKIAEMRRARVGNEPGDPARLAQAIIELANGETAPLRLPLGGDALDWRRKQLAATQEEVEAWSDLSRSADFAP